MEKCLSETIAVVLCALSALGGEQLMNLPPPEKGGRFKTPTDLVWPEKPGDADVCLWSGDRFAACSITIDDNCKPDHGWWLKLSEELGIKLTWFVITDHCVYKRNAGLYGTWADWQKLADAGGKGHVQMGAFGETEEEPKWGRGMKSLKRGWNIVLYHFVHAGRTDEDREKNAAGAEKEVRYIASLKDERLWVCRFDDAAKYGQERDSATLTSALKGDKVEFTLTDRMKDDIFDYPLTVKVRLPDGWKSAKATQGGKPVAVRFVSHDGAPYALVEAVPDKGSVTVVRGQ